MGSYNLQRINIEFLNKNKNLFDEQKEFFDKNHNSFQAEYLNTCSDKYVSQLGLKVRKSFESIKNGYENINTWWTGYNKEIEELEAKLASEKLEKYEFYSKNTFYGIQVIDPNTGKPIVEVKEEDANVLEKTGATIVTGAMSLLRGIGNFFEGIGDALTIGEAMNKEAGLEKRRRAGFDLSHVNGEDLTNYREGQFIEVARESSSKEIINPIIDSFFTNTTAGKIANNNGFIKYDGTAAEIIENIGYYGTTILLGTATGGGAAVAAPSLYAAKVGTYSTENFRNGIETPEAISRAGVSAGIDAVDMAIGYGINKFNPIKLSGVVSSQLANSGLHVGLDSLTGTIRTPIQALYDYDVISGKKSYKEKFEELGGFRQIGTDTVTAGVLSGLSEIGDVAKAFKYKDYSHQTFESFRDIMTTQGTKTSKDDMNKVLKMYKEAYEGGDLSKLDIIKKLIEVKKSNPNFHYEISYGNIGSSYWQNGYKEIRISSPIIKVNNVDTLLHESGHAVIDTSVKRGELFKQMKDASSSATKYAENHSTNFYIFQEYVSKRQDLSSSEAFIEYKKSMGISYEEYRKKLIDKYNAALQSYDGYALSLTLEKSNVRITKIMEILEEDTFSSAELADFEMNSDFEAFAHKNDSKLGLGQLADISEALLHKSTILKNTLYGHGAKYYIEGGSDIVTHEIFANYFDLKTTGKTKAIRWLEYAFGKDFVKELDDVYKKIIY